MSKFAKKSELLKGFKNHFENTLEQIKKGPFNKEEGLDFLKSVHSSALDRAIKELEKENE